MNTVMDEGPTTSPYYSERVGWAIAYAARLHATQHRKGKPNEPYLSHILTVAALVVRYGGSENQIISGALHDVPEDCGGLPRLHEIGSIFGPTVERIVEDCSDSLTEDPEVKAPWRDRKIAHLLHSQSEIHPDTALVAACDKIANLTDIVGDLERANGDESIFDRFKGGSRGTRAYYAAMLAVLVGHSIPRGAEEDFRSLLHRVGGSTSPPGIDAVAAFEERTQHLIPTTKNATP
jgi:hypothetical protein